MDFTARVVCARRRPRPRSYLSLWRQVTNSTFELHTASTAFLLVLCLYNHPKVLSLACFNYSCQKLQTHCISHARMCTHGLNNLYLRKYWPHYKLNKIKIISFLFNFRLFSVTTSSSFSLYKVYINIHTCVSVFHVVRRSQLYISLLGIHRSSCLLELR